MLDILIDIMREKHCSFFLYAAIFSDRLRMRPQIIPERNMPLQFRCILAADIHMVIPKVFFSFISEYFPPGDILVSFVVVPDF